ncbi:MAG: hypothetical protein OXG70_01390 [Cyanobacteria bacterium MAG IRC1_bin_28]|nr:hypothetical protein [Cyanobacteria bacterium MAG IRC1_bin_28]MYK86415.1 hypothetical protein [Synechococcus sp. SB0669_bin_7]
MPALPHSLIERLALLTQPAVILLGVGLYVNLLNKRMDDLRDGVNKRIDELRDDMKEIRDDMKEIRQDVKTLLLQQAAKQPVTPER